MNAGTSAGAEPPPGKSLAMANCTYCHVVASDQKFTPVLRPQGPNFSAVAANPKTTAAGLKTFLKTTHQNFSNAKGMPNPVLSSDQVDELVAYIMGQRPQRQP